ncbi:hypothetical protein AcV5_003214 [Taiwanofungus camphoratus]|nr:hypothetical protein AcV5_003214 [Antrodia cinnamomea]
MTETSSSAIATIADIDSLVANDASNLPYESKVKVNPFEMRFLELSLPHRRLLRLKFLYHTHPTVDKRFQEHREIHLLDAHSATPSPVHLRAYEKAFSEVNRANASCFGGGRVQRFLDLGCSPGGFSTWLFKSNWAAQGVGITLPDEDAKYPMQIDPVIASPDRYRVQYDNIITLVMKSVDLDANPVIALREDDQHAESNSYDLVVAGAFPTLEGHIPWWHRVQMILSQLLIIMSNVARDGVCVIIINMKPFLWLVDVIGLLRQTFGTITTTKGGKFHALRTSCYLVCRDFHAADEEVQRVTARIRHVLRHLDTVSKARADAARAGESEEDGSSERTSDSPEDVPLMSGESASEVFEAQHRFVLDLFEPLWVTQYDAIHADFAKVLSEQSGGQ